MHHIYIFFIITWIASSNSYNIKKINGLIKRILPFGVVLGLSSVSFPIPTIALEGSEAKMEFFKPEDTSKIGSAIYNENSKQNELFSKIDKKWHEMCSTVEADLKKGSISSKADAKSSISLALNSLKSDMRTLSKIKSGGDILEKGGMGLSKFDYNTGQFSLKEAAAKAESVFSEVNDLYFYTIDKSSDEALLQLKKADVLYEDWKRLM